MSTTNSTNISTFLAEVHNLYNVGLTNTAAIQKALVSKDNYVTIEVQDVNGTKQLTIPSFNYILHQLANFKQNLEQLTYLQDGSSYATLINSADGKIRELFELSHNKKPFINAQNNLATINSIQVDNELMRSLYMPNVVMNVDITNMTKTHSRHIELTKLILSNYTDYSSHKTIIESKAAYADVIAYLSEQNIQYSIEHFTLPINYYKSRYTGDFSILKATKLQTGDFELVLDTVNYTDTLNAKKNSKELVVGDSLAILEYNSLYVVKSVNVSNNTIIAYRKYGYTDIVPGVSTAIYVDENVKRTVNIPIRFNDNGFYTIESTHILHGTVSNKSNVIAYSSKEFTININDTLMSVDEYIRNSNGGSVSDYLSSLVSQNAIPLQYAIKPDKPTLTSSMLNVVQINKHIVEGAEVEYITKLYANQNKLAAELKTSNVNINNIKSALDSSNYKNEAERKELVSSLNKELANNKSLYSQYSSIINELDTKDIGLYASTYSPKYRVRGFWPIQEYIESEFTRNQNIIAYKIQYRYVSANNQIAKADNYNVVSEVDGNTVETTGAFSVWNEMTTAVRRRIINADGSVSFDANNIADAETININQLDIPITVNEQVDIRLKAISEVGWPNVSIESDWSDTVRVSFPKEFSNSIDFAKLEQQVKEEKQKIELNDIISNAGLLKHIQNSIQEQHTYFAHIASEIDSGFTTPELNRVPLFAKLTEIVSKIQTLEDVIINNSNTLKLSIVDAADNEYAIVNNSTIKVFAGYYTDFATANAMGDIVNHQLYLKIANSKNMEIYSIEPGDFNVDISNTKYNRAAVGYVQSDTRALVKGYMQTKGQIAYLRNRNVINNFDLYEDNALLTTPLTTSVPESIQDLSSTNKHIVHINSTTNMLEAIALQSNATFDGVAALDSHPLYTSNPAELRSILTGLASELYLPTNIKQTAYYASKPKLLFHQNDKYLVGSKTTGAYLALNAINENALHVQSNAIDSYKAVNANDALLIPILFQYRMTDALGNINGIANNTDTNLTMTKTVGIDILLNGQVYSFDLEVTAKYAPSIVGTNNLPKINSSSNNAGLN
jgi:hypothetical protein